MFVPYIYPLLLTGDSAQFCEMTDGAVVSGDTDGGRLLPPLSVHCHLHHVSVHFAVPQRLQLLQDYARCLFSQHNSQGKASPYSPVLRSFYSLHVN